MKIDVCRTQKGVIRADIEIMGHEMYAQSDTIHGAIRNLAFEVQQHQAIENEQLAEWHKEPYEQCPTCKSDARHLHPIRSLIDGLCKDPWHKSAVAGSIA